MEACRHCSVAVGARNEPTKAFFAPPPLVGSSNKQEEGSAVEAKARVSFRLAPPTSFRRHSTATYLCSWTRTYGFSFLSALSAWQLVMGGFCVCKRRRRKKKKDKKIKRNHLWVQYPVLHTLQHVAEQFTCY